MASLSEQIENSLLRSQSQHATPSRRSSEESGQSVSSDTSAVRNSANRLMVNREVNDIVKSWNLRFSDEITEDFRTVLAMHRIRDGLSDKEMLLTASEILDWPALIWYHSDSDEWSGYADFVADARDWFSDSVNSQTCTL